MLMCDKVTLNDSRHYSSKERNKLATCSLFLFMVFLDMDLYNQGINIFRSIPSWFEELE